jgi:hypothetical protein
MSQETLSTAAAVGTFVVIAVTAFAAFFQLRHIRVANQLGAVLTILQVYQTPDIQRPMEYIRREHGAKLRDPDYLRAVEQGEIEPEVRVAIDLHEQLGYFLRQGLVHESFLGVWSPTGSRTWDRLSPIVELGRRSLGSTYLQYFEYFVSREREWQRRHAGEVFPAGVARLPLRDAWSELAQDHPQADH